jgi:transposase
MQIAVGVDSHKSSFSVGVVDEMGRKLGVHLFRNTPTGFAAAHRWIASFGPCLIGIEGSGRYGSPLAEFLERAGETVYEVPATLTFRERNRQRSRGKSDPIDALAIARVVARGEGLAPIRHDDACGDLKALSDYRDQLIHTRTELANQTHQDLVVIAPGYEGRIRNLVSKKNLAAALAIVCSDHSVRAGLVHRRIAQIRRLDAEIADIGDHIETRLQGSGSSLTEIHGVGPMVAARILGEVGDPRWITSRAAFGVLSGTAPLQASSGVVTRHRLNRGGNRQLNRALHVVAFTQARSCTEARAYMERKRAEGKSYREALRCLKRNLANVIYRRLMDDLRTAEVAA